MYRFNATIHAAESSDNAAALGGDKVTLRGEELTSLQLSTAQLYTPFNCTFEQAAALLDQHGRVHFEPDGSFVWGEGADAERWQVDGHLFDRGGHLLYMHLKGTCPSEVFDDLLRAVGWPDQPIVIQLQQEGYVLDEANFRRFAASKGE